MLKGTKRMNKVKIVVDSTVDLTSELYKKYDLFVMPLSVNFGEQSYKDGVDITPDEIYKKVKEGSPLPSTAAIPPQTFVDQLKLFIDDGYDIVFMGIGGGLSTTLQNIHIAMEELEEGRVFPLDSKNLSSGTGLLALKAAKLRDEGKSAKEIVDYLETIVDKVSAKFVLERLDYMRKGGRCSTFTAIFGTLLHIHPILKMVDGKLGVEKKPRGPMKAAYMEMVKELKEDLPNIDFDHVMITHAGIDDDGLKFVYDQVAQLVDPKIIEITRAGCVVSSHCGYGTIGILYIKK